MGNARDTGTGRRRESFDRVADVYDRHRPAPPVDVVDAIVASCDLHEGSRVLEIGCGTGQLSVPLAQRGVDLVAVELGSRLAAIARRNLSDLPNARVETGSFEEWSLRDRTFDAVVCANAFHWLDPDVRFTKTASALRTGGALAILHVHHVRGGTPGFFEDTQPSYVTWGLSDDPFFEPTAPADAPTMYPELDDLDEFGSVARRRFEIPIALTTSSYVGWLRTDSLVNSLDDDARRGFLRDIEALIETRYDGSVVRNFVYELIVARRDS
ncbi:MAG TPA: methyltransferase domain-containing protein [Acidimicrobiia bacterium]|jgi:SAM-dependent methyltransferase